MKNSLRSTMRRVCRFSFLATLAILVSLSGCKKRDALSNEEDVEPVARNLAGPIELAIVAPTTEILLPFAGLSEEIVAEVRYSETGEPVTGQELVWSIDGSAGGSALQTLRTDNTDELGRGVNRVESGNSDAEFTVVVRAAQLDGSILEARKAVQVADIDKGGLTVSFAYDQTLPLYGIETRVHRGALKCDGLAWTRNPPASVAVCTVAGIANEECEVLAESSTDRPQFDGLIEEEVYTVSARVIGADRDGDGPFDGVIAKGCAHTPVIVGNTQNQVRVPLELAPDSAAGTYEFGVEMDLTDALGPAGDTIREIEGIFEDPAAALVDLLADQLLSETQIDDSDFARETAATILRNLLDRFAPPWVTDIQNGGIDLVSVATDLKLGGDLVVGEPLGDGSGARSVEGRWDFSQLVVQWRWGRDCDPTDACCGRQQIDGSNLGFDLLGSQFTGTLRPRGEVGRIAYDLHIDQHRLELQYGKVVDGLLRELLLKRVTGQDDYGCALESLFCAEGANFSCDDPSGNSSSNDNPCGCALMVQEIDDLLTRDGESDPLFDLGAIAGPVCEGFIDQGEALLEGLIEELVAEQIGRTYVLMSVDGILADNDFDLFADRIESTSVEGTMVFDNRRGDFDGSMQAERRRLLCDSDSDCGEYDSCRMMLNPVNTCTGQTVCAISVGGGTAGQICSRDQECASGACLSSGLARGQCYSACRNNADCSGAQCLEGGAVLTLDNGAKVSAPACGG